MVDEKSPVEEQAEAVTEETIAIFGATGRTGRETVKLALSQGYKVRALVRNPEKLADIIKPDEDDSLCTIQGSLTDSTKLEEVFAVHVDYVICMASAPPNDAGSNYPTDFMLNFVKDLLTTIHKKPKKPKLMLYQAGSMSTDGNGYLHPMAYISKHTLGKKLNIFSKIHDNDAAIQYIAQHAGGGSMKEDEDDSIMHYVVTRAGILKDVPSERDMIVSSWPPMPIFYYATFSDLAKFSLKAIKDKDLYDTCPFVR